MKTIKRTIPDIDTTLANTTKYFNHMNFKGILDDDNLFTVDQESFKEAKNIYVDWRDRLTSRPTLQHDELPPRIKVFLETAQYFELGYILFDIIQTGSGNVYVLKATKDGPNKDKYSIIFVPKDGTTITEDKDLISNVTDYHISVIEHYIIAFNDLGAKIFDTNNILAGWQDFNAFVDIPIYQRIVGNTIKTYDNLNEFNPYTYKREYIWSAESHPTLPGATPMNVTLADGTGTYDFGILPNIKDAVDYRLIRPIILPSQLSANKYSVTIGYNKTLAIDVICVAFDNYFMYSLNKGQSFTKVRYPSFTPLGLNNGPSAPSVSKDGRYFFFIAKEGVYRFNLGEDELTGWGTVFTPDSLSGTIDEEEILSYCYNSENTFAFLAVKTTGTAQTDIFTVYAKGPGLYNGSDPSKDYTDEETQYQFGSYKTFKYVPNDPSGTVHTDTLTNLSRTDKHARSIDMFTSIDITGKTVMNVVLTESVKSDLDKTYLITIFGGSLNTQETTIAYTVVASITVINIPELSLTGEETLDTKRTVKVVSSSTLIAAKPKISGYSRWSFGAEFDCIIGAQTEEPEDGETVDSYYQLYRGTITFGYAVSTSQTQTTYVGLQQFNDNYDFIPPISSTLGIDLTGYARRVLPYALIGGYIYSDSTNKAVVLETGKIDWERLVIPATDTHVNQFVVNNPTVKDHLYLMYNNLLWTNNILGADADLSTNIFSLIETVIDYEHSDFKYTNVPQVSYSDTNLYLGFNKLLQITRNIVDKEDPTKILFNLPVVNNQSFIDNITGLINISTTEVAIFFKDKIVICSKVQDENISYGYRYDYYNTKLSTGIRLGDKVMNTLEGSLTVFPTRRGLAAMNYQAFMATTDQILEYLTDSVKDLWQDFYENSDSTKINIIQWRNKLVITNETNTILLFDLSKNAWWKWEVPVKVFTTLTDQISLRLVKDTLLVFEDYAIQNNEQVALRYYDFSKDSKGLTINWQLISQPIHFNAPNYYKNIKQLIFQFHDMETDSVNKTLQAQIKVYRKSAIVRDPEIVSFEIEEMRTFVKRFNYWKINEIQWGLANDDETSTPQKFELNGLTIKYELGEEVR